ncbi:hypothetical protein K3495_g5674 [Podosphaera aphanis]|nr:hypothetical protein K3495_g5674 [Podosphaera aphanis]
MPEKLAPRPLGSLESKLSTSFDSAVSDSSFSERADFFSGVRKGIKKLGSISTNSRPIAYSASERSAACTPDAPRSAGADRKPPVNKGHARSTSDLGKPLPATPATRNIDLLLRAPHSPHLITSQLINSGVPYTSINSSRTNTMDSTTSEASSIYTAFKSSTDMHEDDDRKGESSSSKSSGPSPAPQSSGINSRPSGTSLPGSSSQHLSGLMCNVHRTTGQMPRPLVGATTTILGDKLYVFGGRKSSKSQPVLTSDLYELDLIQRHWMRIPTCGDTPPPRYFHSLCPLGDTKLVCYGGMSPAPTQDQTRPVSTAHNPDAQAEVVVMSDVYIFDVPTRRWTFIPSPDSPQGRYAHCATILPSSAVFSSIIDPSSAIHRDPTGLTPIQGTVGSNIDGTGGAQMVIVGGQDSANHYIEQISVFNLRSLRWTSTQQLGKSCGAYRSVVTPLPCKTSVCLGKSSLLTNSENSSIRQSFKDSGSSMLIYSNYNFLDVKLELQIRGPDGKLVEKQMQGTFSPPGLRFPSGGVVDTTFVVSGTYLTSSKQEYALWALDLRTLTWSRIDAGGSVFSQGSWNRGVLWNRRNTFVILGDRRRSLVDDYNHRRINFTNVCMVELEAFGLYDNPRKVSPMSDFISASCPFTPSSMKLVSKTGWSVGGRPLSKAAEDLGQAALGMRELADMEILCVNGERLPINSRIVAKRWGPYFIQLLREGAATQDSSDTATLRADSNLCKPDRNSSVTITPKNVQSFTDSQSSTLINSGISTTALSDNAALINPPDAASLSPMARPRTLYLPHKQATVQALLHYLYTSSLPPPTSPLCKIQVLCSLLQISRPYKIDGLLESVVERLHGILDSRNAAAVFNASAMAAGGGRSISSPEETWSSSDTPDLLSTPGSPSAYKTNDQGLKLNTSSTDLGGGGGSSYDEDEPSSATESINSDWSSSEMSLGGRSKKRLRNGRPTWSGSMSEVIGLQKRGLRGLMEGRRLRERSASISVRDGLGGDSLGLGISG